MSVESVSKFFEMLDEHEALQQEYATVTDEAVRKALSSSAIAMASMHGVEFTEEDLAQHLNSLSEELGDQDLDQVAGGALPDPMPSPGRFSLNFARLTKPGGGMTGLVSNNPIPLPNRRWGGDGGDPT
jgi:predicted ribosomally synthesized peptide with nif11-like leader